MPITSRVVLILSFLLSQGACRFLTVKECETNGDCKRYQECNTSTGRCWLPPLPDVTVDSGFTLGQHAFSFANFAGRDPDSTLTADLMQRMWGKQAVCASEVGSCRMKPGAKEFQRLINLSLQGGRCEGFAILADLMFQEQLSPADFGASTAAGIEPDKPEIKAELAYWFATQYLFDVVRDTTRSLEAEGLVRFLATEFAKPQHPMYRLGITRLAEDGTRTGGHAVVPIAVVPKGNGEYSITLYDNNHPTQERELKVDVGAGSWEYEASANPEQKSALYKGDPSNGNVLYLAEALPRMGLHACSFCSDSTEEARQLFASGGTSLNASDESGRRTGEVNGKLVAEIPGSMVVPVFSAETYDDRAPMQIILPGDSTLQLSMRSPGTAGEGQPDDVIIFSSGSLVGVSNIGLEGGGEATLSLSSGTDAVTFTPAGSASTTITVSQTTASGEEVLVSATLPSDSQVDSVTVGVDEETGNPSVQVDSSDGQDTTMDLSVVRSDAEGEDTLESSVDVPSGGEAEVDVENWEGEGNPATVLVDSTGDGEPDQTVSVDDTGPVGQPPLAPTNLVATALSNAVVRLEWSDGSTNEDGFEIERDEGTGFLFLVTVPANTGSFDDGSVQISTTYVYRVRARNPYGVSEFTVPAEATTPGCETGWQDHDGDKNCQPACGVDTCHGHGTCDDSTGTAQCQCNAEYAGAGCESCASGYQDNDADGICTTGCALETCSGHGSCDDSTGAAACTCEAGYEGTHCELCAAGYQDHDANQTCTPDCSQETCSGHGSCVDASGTATCVCQPEFTGTHCELCAPGYCESDWVCGNGVTNPQTGEVCDDGNTVSGDGCNASCTSTEVCGNGFRDPNEMCDDGNVSSGDGCNATCTSTEVCGNGYRDPSEMCDDGDTESGDGCNATCTSTEVCGNSFPDPGEVCDDGNVSSGDGCNATCTSTEVCGNGFTDPGEMCDDGDTVSGDGCNAKCTSTEVCGNSFPDPGEVCDDGNVSSGDGCNATCTSTEVCGNSLPDSGEACDDGNPVNDDGCSSSCAVEAGWMCSGVPSTCNATCGDGLMKGTEVCDDGNTDNNDGCSSSCAVESGWTCSGMPSTCSANCGDGTMMGTEACDDGGTADGDGCSSVCAVEPGWICMGAPSVCWSSCGDGIQNGTDACDDGDVDSGDGCSASCTLEPGWTCVGSPSVCSTTCGDATMAGTEQCDGPDLGAATCMMLGYAGGVLSCDLGCQFDTSACWACGNGVLEGTEACDGPDLGGRSCADLGFTGGVLSCNPACTGFDTSACIACGDGAVEGMEVCDDGNTVTETSCPYGTPSCMACVADCSATIPLQGPYCGDGFSDPVHEQCDANGENPMCDADCTVAVCGDGHHNPLAGEACDDGVHVVNNLVSVTAEPGGANCPFGGQAISNGLDQDGNQLLSPLEITNTTYVCNDVSGFNALVRLEPELPGVNCPHGGTAVHSGTDTDNSGALDGSEVTSITYVCNDSLGNTVDSDACSNGCTVNTVADLCWASAGDETQCPTVCGSDGRIWPGQWVCDPGMYSWCTTGCICRCELPCSGANSTCTAGNTTYCADLQTNDDNCGTCGFHCEGALQCIAAGCACLVGSPCGTGEATICGVNLATDVSNCGGCGNDCTTLPEVAAASCAGGTCGISACREGFSDCDALPANGCETNVWTNVNHCGGCGNVCVGGSCMFGECTTGAEGAFAPVTDTVLPPGVHQFTTIDIPLGVKVTTNGSGVLDLRATGAVTIAGIIDVSGGAGGGGSQSDCSGFGKGAGAGGATGNPLAVGASGVADCAANYSGGGGSGVAGNPSVGSEFCGPIPGGQNGGGAGASLGGGGGGGGGFAGGGGGGTYRFGNNNNGGFGGNGASAEGGTGGGGDDGTGAGGGGGGGAPYAGQNGLRQPDTPELCGGATQNEYYYTGSGGGGGSIGLAAINDLAMKTTFVTGSAGGGGGGAYGCSYGGGGGGGGAGGALRISSMVSINVTGSLLANGGNGGPARFTGGGGGGGSGGAIYLAAPNLAVGAAATISAVGGAGGAMETDCLNGGGTGGLGRIRLSATLATCTLDGQFNPPLESGCNPTAVSGKTYVASWPD